MEAMFRNDIVLLENIVHETSRPTGLKLALLEYMTGNFSAEREIGRGRFGVVYKGVFGDLNIAVKKLKFSNTAEKEFDREIGRLVSVHHKNIVRFLGYYNKRASTLENVAEPGDVENLSAVNMQERILCFEYISNGSLAAHIHDELRGLEWHTRYKILKEICQALDYLHNEKRLVHRDLKPDNILLDDLLVPKIADLGISKLFKAGALRAKTTNPSVTWEYAAPEFKDREVSVKYDIYSLGIIINELVSGYRQTPDLKTVLTRWRYRWNKSKETLRYQQVAKCIEIGLSCKNVNPRKRPSISKIIKDLEDVDAGNGAVGQVIPPWNDILWIEPPELFFPFMVNKQISCSFELHNETHVHMAFFIKTDKELLYKMEPEKGVVQPCSHFTLNIILLAQEKQPGKIRNPGEFTIKSTRVNEGLTAKHITKEMFSKKSGNIVDKMRLGVVFDAQLRAACTVEAESRTHSVSHLDKRFSQDLTGKSIIPSTSRITSRPSSGHGEASSSTHSNNYLDLTGQSIIPSTSRITSRPSSGHSEASSSTHSNNYLLAIEPKAMTFQDLYRLTDCFSEERLLGKGGFGMVYKGVFDNGEVIAVKKLHNNPGLVEDQFYNELLNLMAAKHQNIIRLVGYCFEAPKLLDNHMEEDYREERALCLEYMEGGTLEELLSDESCGLDWGERYKIINGICQGLKYLHTGLEDPIYHLDLKPANILLDKDRIPKIGDFGLSRLLASTDTFVTQMAFGTLAYMPLEYMYGRQISQKFDVFSLGVIIIQIVGGPESYYTYKCLMSRQEFLDHVTGNWRRREQAEQMPMEALLEVEECIKMALRCVEDNRANRPTITEIVEELNMISRYANHNL